MTAPEFSHIITVAEAGPGRSVAIEASNSALTCASGNAELAANTGA